MMMQERAKLRSRRGRKFTIGLAWRVSQKIKLAAPRTSRYAECLDASKGVAKPIPLLSFAEQHFPANDCENEQPEANGVELERPPFRRHPLVTKIFWVLHHRGAK